MNVLNRKFITSCLINPLKRNLYTTVTNHHSYEVDGKTTVNILNKNSVNGLMIDRVTEQGFILNNGIRIIGPMVILPKSVLCWNIACSEDMNEECFSLLLNLNPKLDLVIVGLDDKYPYNSPFLLNIKNVFKENKVNLEIVSVHRACSTFNFLNSEKRYVAAAVIPPKIKNSERLTLNKGIQRMNRV